MIVLATVYQPGQQLHEFLAALPAAHTVVLVDDGSDPPVRTDRGTVLRHDVNRGKGVALKTGLRHIAAEHPGEPVVCADPDGQHEIADVLKVGEQVAAHGRMTLGVRRFDRKVPLRNRFGNQVTRGLFRVATGRSVRDTQTGLRGYPADQLEWLLGLPGEQFEYEMNVLLRAAEAGLPIDQVAITTTYEGATSHFGSLSDSARIYRPLLGHAAGRLADSLRGRSPAATG